MALVASLRAAKQDRRLHQRRLRPAASRARPLPRRSRGALGDALILGLNADASVRRNKGPARPITSRTGTRRSPRGALVGRRGRDLRRGHARARSSRPCSPTSSSRARTGPPTRSSAATPSRRAAAASCSFPSNRGIRRRRSSSGCAERGADGLSLQLSAVSCQLSAKPSRSRSCDSDLEAFS